MKFEIDDFLNAQSPHLRVSPKFMLVDLTWQKTLPVSLKIEQIMWRDYDSIQVCMTVADVFRQHIDKS